MKTMVVMDERIVRYLIALVQAESPTTEPDLQAETMHALRFSLSILERAKKDSEEKEKS